MSGILALGYCFNGECPTLDGQCEKIWEYAGVAADQQCYDQFNTKGSINGHCGKDLNGDYKKCELEYVSKAILPATLNELTQNCLSLLRFSYRNVKCGSLQCKDGDRQPTIAGMDQMSSKTIISIKGVEYECK